jgi:hypothetical protein
VRIALIGAGAREALEAGGEGAVLAWFPRACYLTLPGGLVTLVAPQVHPGPTHAVLDRAMPRVESGALVRAGRGWIDVGGRRVDRDAATLWRGARPAPDDRRAAA